MNENKGHIQQLFDRLDGERTTDLEFNRKCARLCGRPQVLPDKSFEDKNKHRIMRGEEEIPPNYQSIGQRGTSSLKGHFLTNGFPTDYPWFSFAIPGPWLYDPSIPVEAKTKAENDLFMAQLILASVMESAPLDKDSRTAGMRASLGFRSAIGRALDNLIITGDALIFMRDDYRLRSFRRDWYVTKRDTCGDVLCHVIKEMKEPLELADKQLEKADIKKSELKEEATDRQMPMFTYPEWQPVTKVWTIKQEINGKVFNEFDEPITPYISVPFAITDGCDYGYGFPALNYGDLSTFDRIEEACVDYAAICSKVHPVRDVSSLVRDRDLTARTGTIINNVRMGANGKPTDIGFASVDKLNDFNVVQMVREAKRKDLGAASLLESESAPKGEAGRHSTAWKMTYAELERITGGLYPAITEGLQVNLIRRMVYQAQRDKLITKFDIKNVRINVLTGLAAMEREAKRQKLLEFAQVIQSLGPDAQSRIDPAVFIDVFQRYSNFYEPGLVKSQEQVQKETQSAIAAQTQLAAAQKGIDVLGNAAEASLVPSAA